MHASLQFLEVMQQWTVRNKPTLHALDQHAIAMLAQLALASLALVFSAVAGDACTFCAVDDQGATPSDN